MQKPAASPGPPDSPDPAESSNAAESTTPTAAYCIGLVLSGPCGVHDHGHLLATELRQCGLQVHEKWLVSDGHNFREAMVTAWRLLASATRVPRDSPVVWHYSVFGYGFRGIPLFGVLFGTLLRLRGVRVITFLHEPALPWNRKLDKKAVISFTQWLALQLVVAGSSEVIVTTPRRIKDLPRRTRSRCVVIPVFSNIAVEPPEPAPRSQSESASGSGSQSTPQSGPGTARGSSGPFVVGVVGYANDGVDPSLLLEALSRLPSRSGLRVLLLGAPGPGSAWGQRWTRAAQAAGLGDLLEFTGVLPPPELSRQLSACDLVLFPDQGGPSSRKGTLAAALAHGRPVIAIDGPEGWPPLTEAGAVHLSTADPAQLATAIDELRRDVVARNRLAASATTFYSQHMRLELAGAKVVALMRTTTPESSTGQVQGVTSRR